MRDALERARWQSGTTPTLEDRRKLEEFAKKCRTETAKVEAEAEWLCDEDGTTGMGRRIWPTAFELNAQASMQSAEHERLLQAHHEKTLQAYAEHTAKPWPSELPGTKQRFAYDQMKTSILGQLPRSVQARMFQGHNTSQVISNQNACQLRAALLARCQQAIPLIQRLQAEGHALKIATERGHVDTKDADSFEAIDTFIKEEIESVNAEAEWLSDNTQNGTKEIWPDAFKIYTKRRAEVAKQILVAQLQHPELLDYQHLDGHPGVIANAID